MEHQVLDRAGAAALVPELASWEAGRTYQPGIHAGDVGWHTCGWPMVAAGFVPVETVQGLVLRPASRATPGGGR